MFTRAFRSLRNLVRQHSTSSGVGAAISTVASVFAIGSACYVGKGLQEQTRKDFGRGFAELQSDFYTTELVRAQRKLYNLKKRTDNEGRNWEDVCGEWAADDLTLALTPPEKLSKEQKIRFEEVEEIEEARRKWSAFFRKFRSLYKRGVISEEDVKQHHFPSETQMKGYISVVEPMEHACSVIFVGNVEKYISARYRQAHLAAFLDITFLDGGLIPTEEKLRERNDKYISLREQVLDEMKPDAQEKGKWYQWFKL